MPQLVDLVRLCPPAALQVEAEAFGAPEPEISIDSDYTPSTYNDPALTSTAMAAISGAIGEDNVTEVTPVMGGEDFSQFGRTQEDVPGLIFWLGAISPETYEQARNGETSLPSLHSPFFAPDAAPTIETGVKSMTAAAMALFNDG